MSHTHDEGNPGAETCHKAAPMVEEITDYEILEIAVRELAIEHGLFTAEDHRRFREFAESIGPAGGSRLDRPRLQGPCLGGRHHSLQGD